MTQERWQLTGTGPDSYERYQVPSVFEPLARIFLQRVPLLPGQRVLDVACGPGIIVRQAAPILGSAGRLVGVDLNANMLEGARKRGPTDGAPVEWRQGDAASLPCSSSEFDIVICQQGLQFFWDKAGALAEMHRVLKPGGLLAICVWRPIEHSPCHLAIAEALSRHVNEDVARRFQTPFSFGDAAALNALLTESGFCQVEIRVEVIMRRLLPPEESVPNLLASTPVGSEIMALDELSRDAIVNDVATTLSEYRDEDGLMVPQSTYIALGVK